MSKFIELTWTTGDKTILLNIEKIAYLAKSPEEANYTRIYFTGIGKDGADLIAVRESFEEIKRLISEAQS